MNFDRNDPKWTAYALDEVDEKERQDIERELSRNEEARQFVEEIRETGLWLTDELQSEPVAELSHSQREEIRDRAKRPRLNLFAPLPAGLSAAAGLILVVLLAVYWNPREILREAAELSQRTEVAATEQTAVKPGTNEEALDHAAANDTSRREALEPNPAVVTEQPKETVERLGGQATPDALQVDAVAPPDPAPQRSTAAPVLSTSSIEGYVTDTLGGVIPGAEVQVVSLRNQESETKIADDEGRFRFEGLEAGDWKLEAALDGFKKKARTLNLPAAEDMKLDLALEIGEFTEEVIVVATPPMVETSEMRIVTRKAEDLPLNGRNVLPVNGLQPGVDPRRELSKSFTASFGATEARVLGPDGVALDPNLAPRPPEFNTEAYDHIRDNSFQDVRRNPLSTFSIDVDTASYSNLRRFLQQGQLPPKDAVRIEELVNYFDYEYEGPASQHPFATHLELSQAPWNRAHRLLRVGLKGREIPENERPAANLVFLIDVSGSMQPSNKLPLLKRGLKLLVNRLSHQDRVAIVVYAGAAGLVLPSTACDEKDSVLSALERLHAGGSTHGSAGIKLAYETARRHFIKGGINRVILATDGDFNVGVSSQGELTRLIERERESGVFLSVLGFGQGNYKDSTLELLADKGNGNYAYIDTLREARKVLVEEMGGTLMTIAKDVKIQIEFNPAVISAYRLIGYENRLLAAEDFNDDRKDAGEIGAGHTVTALYELVPVGAEVPAGSVDALKYQQPSVSSKPEGRPTKEALTLKLRYKQPTENTSRLIEVPVLDRNTPTSLDFRFAAAVAAFGMILRDSQFKGTSDIDLVVKLAQPSLGADPNGHRAEFLSLVKGSRPLVK